MSISKVGIFIQKVLANKSHGPPNLSVVSIIKKQFFSLTVVFRPLPSFQLLSILSVEIVVKILQNLFESCQKQFCLKDYHRPKLFFETIFEFFCYLRNVPLSGGEKVQRKVFCFRQTVIDEKQCFSTALRISKSRFNFLSNLVDGMHSRQQTQTWVLIKHYKEFAAEKNFLC